MKILHAPWRADYTTGSARNNRDGQPKEECVFCEQIASHHDEKHYILRRYTNHVVMLNLFPYNAGHLLVVSNNHVASLDELSTQARAELIEIMNTCTQLVKKTFGADGVNIGFNLGKAAGAGIPSHLHGHILPRFTGDTNFMPTIAGTKVISFDLTTIFEQLRMQLAMP